MTHQTTAFGKLVLVVTSLFILAGCFKTGDPGTPLAETTLSFRFDLDEADGQGLNVLISSRDATRLGIPSTMPAIPNPQSGRMAIDVVATNYPRINNSGPEICFDDSVQVEDTLNATTIEIVAAGTCLDGYRVNISGVRDS